MNSNGWQGFVRSFHPSRVGREAQVATRALACEKWDETATIGIAGLNVLACGHFSRDFTSRLVYLSSNFCYFGLGITL